MADRNTLDVIGKDLHAELKATARKMASIIKGGQRPGMRKMSPEEQAMQFLQMTPIQRQAIKAKLGEFVWEEYEEKQVDFLFERIGAAAVHLLPYVAPNLALALEERAMREMNALGGEEVPYV